VVKKNGLSTDDLMILHRELSILSKLDCPNIVKYLENYEDENYIYICMELLQGGESGDLMMRMGRPFNEAELASMTKHMICALNHCHGQNIIHRDIKPANMMIDDCGETKLIDFGLAVAKSKKESMLNPLSGTPLFMAPEVLTSDYGIASDIWSLGATLFYLGSAQFPFDIFGKETLNDLTEKIRK
jgi:calcium-dependent protein kinase